MMSMQRQVGDINTGEKLSDFTEHRIPKPCREAVSLYLVLCCQEHGVAGCVHIRHRSCRPTPLLEAGVLRPPANTHILTQCTEARRHARGPESGCLRWVGMSSVSAKSASFLRPPHRGVLSPGHTTGHLAPRALRAEQACARRRITVRQV